MSHSEQPMPIPRPGVVGTHDMVIAELEAMTGVSGVWRSAWTQGRVVSPELLARTLAAFERRRDLGRERYGVLLCPDAGRDTGRDALEEALDLAVYLRNWMREGTRVHCAYDLAMEIVFDLVERQGKT